MLYAVSFGVRVESPEDFDPNNATQVSSLLTDVVRDPISRLGEGVTVKRVDTMGGAQYDDDERTLTCAGIAFIESPSRARLVSKWATAWGLPENDVDILVTQPIDDLIA